MLVVWVVVVFCAKLELYYKRRAILPPGVLPIIVENSSANMKPQRQGRNDERNIFGNLGCGLRDGALFRINYTQNMAAELIIWCVVYPTDG